MRRGSSSSLLHARILFALSWRAGRLETRESRSRALAIGTQGASVLGRTSDR